MARVVLQKEEGSRFECVSVSVLSKHGPYTFVHRFRLTTVGVERDVLSQRLKCYILRANLLTRRRRRYRTTVFFVIVTHQFESTIFILQIILCYSDNFS